MLIKIARELYAEEDFGLELDQTVYAFDSTILDLLLGRSPARTCKTFCLRLFKRFFPFAIAYPRDHKSANRVYAADMGQLIACICNQENNGKL